MRIINVGAFATALVSIPLYLSLMITCIYYALKFWEVIQGRADGGLYGRPKFAFFVVLGFSAMLDLPSFLTCVGKGGPNECIWNDNSYAFTWSCHLIATCGYLFAVITPSILWSDIIRQKDGNFWNSSSPLDGTKIFFRIAFVIYCCVIITNVMGVIIYSKSSDESAYSDSNALGALNNCLMPIMLVVVTFGCFWSGQQLRQYVKNVQLGGAIQLRILLKLNFTMVMICVSYTVRAILVMSLYEDIPHPYKHALHGTWQYPIWLPITQWIPFVLCSFCLVNEMKFHGGGKGGAGRAVSSSSSVEGQRSTDKTSRGKSGEGGAEGNGTWTGKPEVDVTDPDYEARAMNHSIDSIFSDIARTQSTGQSSNRSRSRYASRPGAEGEGTLNILMTDLHLIEEGEEEPPKSRAVSADNYFDSPALQHEDIGADHFFPASAMPQGHRNSR